jgi:hypothetical protein
LGIANAVIAIDLRNKPNPSCFSSKALSNLEALYIAFKLPIDRTTTRGIPSPAMSNLKFRRSTQGKDFYSAIN